MKLTYMQRLEAALRYKSGKGTYERIAKEYGIKLSLLQEIVSKYESLEKSGKGSLIEICRKYKIRSKMALRDRIKWYNGHMGSSKTKGQLC